MKILTNGTDSQGDADKVETQREKQPRQRNRHMEGPRVEPDGYVMFWLQQHEKKACKKATSVRIEF